MSVFICSLSLSHFSTAYRKTQALFRADLFHSLSPSVEYSSNFFVCLRSSVLASVVVRVICYRFLRGYYMHWTDLNWNTRFCECEWQTAKILSEKMFESHTKYTPNECKKMFEIKKMHIVYWERAFALSFANTIHTDTYTPLHKHLFRVH